MTVQRQHAWAGSLATSALMNAYTGAPPALVNLDVFHAAVAQTNFDTLTINASHPYNAFKASSGAQNAEINFDVLLSVGTWTFALIYEKNTDSGIVTVQLSADGSTFVAVDQAPYSGSGSTIDTYGASATYGNRATLTGIVIAATGIYRLKLLMATKNGSSSSYFGRLNHAQLQQTA